MGRKSFVFDIDGVLADTSNILLTRKDTRELGFNLESNKYKDSQIDWDYFSTYIDKAIPIEGTMNMFIELAKHNKVFLLTGRIERDRTKILKWLKESIVDIFGDSVLNTINWELLMRPIGCNSSQIEYKESKLIEIMHKGYDIMLMIEDNPAMIDKLTEMGIIGLKSPNEYKDFKGEEIKAINDSEIVNTSSSNRNEIKTYYINSLGEYEVDNG